MKRLVPLFALLVFASVGTLSAQTRDQEIERLKAENARLKALLATRPEDVETLLKEAGALYDQGKYREAKAKATQAYAAFERLPVKDNATRVRYLRLLGILSNYLRENDKTIEYATEVAIYAASDSDRGFAYALLGQAYHSKKEYDKAIEYHEKSLPIRRKVHGVKSSQVATTYVNIGSIHDAKGEGDKAIEYFEKALAIRLNTFGPEHHSVASSYFWIGTVYANKDDKRTAMRYLLKAKAIRLKRLGPNHPSTKDTQSWIDKVNRE